MHIITRLILGGAQENTLITCKLLADRGHDVTLITGPALGPEGELFNQAQNQNYKVIVLDELVREINPVKDFAAYCKLKKLLKELRPDIVHTHSAKAGILGRYAGYALKGTFENKRLPMVVHTIHGLAFHPYQSAMTNKFYIAIENATAKKTDAFICVADAMTNQALAAGMGTCEQYTTAYSAIDEQAFLKPLPCQSIDAFRAAHNISPSATVLVTVARLAELKGHDYIIDSATQLAQEFPHCIWLFVGNGALTGELKNRITAFGLENRFRFTGLIPPSQIPLAIQSSDILVHCSLREGLARALPQAMLCGKPVISFDVDGAKEVVNENTGRLIAPKDVAALIQACRELLRNRALCRHLGENARRSVTTKFAPDTMVDVILQVYNKLMQEAI